MVTIQTRIEGEVAILDLEGKIDGGPDTKKIQERVKELLADKRTRILLNLTGVPWANSLGVGMLIACYASVKREKAELKFFGLSSRVEMAMKVMGVIPGIFESFATETDAMGSFT
jgi:anti-anti-sigma factor